MNKFTEITYDKDTKTLNVGAGLTWEIVYNFLEKHHPNLGVVGANPAVGVSGFLLGGGYSLLTNKHGLGMDNVVGFRVVTPHGPNGPTILDANPRENPDLFKALKVGTLPSYHYNMAFFILNLREEGITSGSSHVLLCGLTRTRHG